jgi:hypothetical protein
LGRECKDGNWPVRKACIDSLYDVANICTEELKEYKKNELTDAVLTFVKDSNKLVKIAAYKSLGPFISTLQGIQINEKLIESYLQMAESSINNISQDNEVYFLIKVITY